MENSNRTFDGFTDIGAFQNQYEVTNPYMNVHKATGSERAAGVLGSVASYAGSGAAMSGGNPWVIGAGALVGLGVGLLGDNAEQSKEADLSKAAEKYNAKLDEVKYAQMNSRAISNNIRSAQAQNTLAQSNLHDYLSDFKNPYV